MQIIYYDTLHIYILIWNIFNQLFYKISFCKGKLRKRVIKSEKNKLEEELKQTHFPILIRIDVIGSWDLIFSFFFFFLALGVQCHSHCLAISYEAAAFKLVMVLLLKETTSPIILLFFEVGFLSHGWVHFCLI